jgi:hypothetical protein
MPRVAPVTMALRPENCFLIRHDYELSQVIGRERGCPARNERKAQNDNCHPQMSEPARLLRFSGGMPAVQQSLDSHPGAGH